MKHWILPSTDITGSVGTALMFDTSFLLTSQCTFENNALSLLNPRSRSLAQKVGADCVRLCTIGAGVLAAVSARPVGVTGFSCTYRKSNSKGIRSPCVVSGCSRPPDDSRAGGRAGLSWPAPPACASCRARASGWGSSSSHPWRHTGGSCPSRSWGQ